MQFEDGIEFGHLTSLYPIAFEGSQFKYVINLEVTILFGR